MLLRITNKCTMGCSHCMIDGSGPEGDHMDEETFEAALDFQDSLGSRFLVLSGGEPTEHPSFFEWVQRAVSWEKGASKVVTIATNGLFALDDLKYEMMVRLVEEHQGFVQVQITNDARYYPRNLTLIQHKFERPYWTFVTGLTVIAPCKRVDQAGIEVSRNAPPCVNVRANVSNLGLRRTIQSLECALRVCSPSVDIDGTVRAGEADTCFRLGTVTSSMEHIEKGFSEMACGICGLRDNLTPSMKLLIGEEEI